MVAIKIPPDVARRLVWSRADSVITPFCSLCGAFIPEDYLPLMMWNARGDCVHFCDDCMVQLLKPLCDD